MGLRGAQLPAEGATDSSAATALDDLNSIHKEVEQCVKKARVAARHAKVGMAVGIWGSDIRVLERCRCSGGCSHCFSIGRNNDACGRVGGGCGNNLCHWMWLCLQGV